MSDFRFDPVAPADLTWLLEVNQAAIPGVSSLTQNEAELVIADSSLTAICRAADAPQPLGVVIVMDPDTRYPSDNYRWYQTRYRQFAYVDRIMVDEAARRRGVGEALYAHVEHWARGLGLVMMACEVNLDPPNPASQAFHARMGFETVERRISAAGKMVAMMVKAFPARDGDVPGGNAR